MRVAVQIWGFQLTRGNNDINQADEFHFRSMKFNINLKKKGNIKKSSQ